MKKEQNEIPLLDCPTDYLIGQASGKIMNEYARFPCKIHCGVYAFMVRGNASATINITTYDFKQNDILVLESGSFLHIHEFTEDALVYYLLFSSDFLEKHAYIPRNATTGFAMPSPVISMNQEQGQLIVKTVETLILATDCHALNTGIMTHFFNMLQQYYADYAIKQNQNAGRPSDRKMEIYQEYCSLVLKHYHEWRQVAEYANAMHITLPHLCTTVKQASGKTASEFISDAIITDAKAQLKITKSQVKEIALSLGFTNVAFFNRFFKLHTGYTPKEYRQA